jgi:hypothetical protein
VPPLSSHWLPEACAELTLHLIRPDSGSQTVQAHEVRTNLYLYIVLAEVELLLRAETLIPEEDYASLGEEEGKLVFLLVGEVLELQTNDLDTDMRAEIFHIRRRRTELFSLDLHGCQRPCIRDRCPG